MGDLPQIQTRIDMKKLHAQTSSTPFRRHSFSDSLLRSRNMDTEQRTRKNDSIDAGNTERLRNEMLGPKKKMERLTSRKCVALMMTAVMVLAHGLRMPWTVKCHLKTRLTRKLIQL